MKTLTMKKLFFIFLLMIWIQGVYGQMQKINVSEEARYRYEERLPFLAAEEKAGRAYFPTGRIVQETGSSLGLMLGIAGIIVVILLIIINLKKR